ncbi:reverse transcriptase domain-containing protein, partial [Tanacetum coccineum]
MNERCSTVLLNKLPLKEKDPGSFTILCEIGNLHIDNALADLGANISLMPYSMYEKLGLGKPKPTRMSLELAHRSIQYPQGIAENVLIKVDKFILPIDFVILDMREDTIIPNRTSYDRCIQQKDNSQASANEIDEKKPELKDVPSRLEYAYLNGDRACLIIVSSKLTKKEKTSLLQVLEKHKGAIAWKMSDIKGISPSFCTHKIFLEENFKPVIQPQRCLNLKVQDVVKNEIVKLIDSGLIYPISDSPWVSPIHVVLKKGGMTVVLNDNNEPVPSRMVTGWRVCIDYRKLNDATRKDHFPLPFIDQMLERLSGNEFYCFLNGFTRFFQISIAPEDQEKTIFAYQRMPFGLYNSPATFQRCMTVIFHDMVEDFMEVFMVDFSVFGNSFNHCL